LYDSGKYRGTEKVSRVALEGRNKILGKATLTCR
jgi:hypothetical protein